MAKQAVSRRNSSSPRKPSVAMLKGLQLQPEAPTHAEIARRAFDLYLSRGGADGSDLNDWLRAECELRSTQN
jgi:hypothetical protein